MTTIEQFLSASMPPPRANTFAARMPGGDNFMPAPAAGQTPNNNPALQYLTVGAGSYRVVTATYPQPTLRIPKARPVITAVVSVPPGVDPIDILAAALKGGDVSLLISTGVTIVAYRAKLEKFVNMSTVVGFPASTDGSAVVLISCSCAPTDYRGS
jgi:hypothetical protein